LAAPIGDPQFQRASTAFKSYASFRLGLGKPWWGPCPCRSPHSRGADANPNRAIQHNDDTDGIAIPTTFALV